MLIKNVTNTLLKSKVASVNIISKFKCWFLSTSETCIILYVNLNNYIIKIVR